MKDFSLIAAVEATTFGIGVKGKLPWKSIPLDMKHFVEVTTLSQSHTINAIIMGRKTWESIPDSSRPLRGRLNVIISHNPLELNVPQGCLVFESFDKALNTLSLTQNIENIFIIGGGQIYKEAIQHPNCAQVYLTKIYGLNVECDTFFPSLDGWKCDESNELMIDLNSETIIHFCTYKRAELS